MATTNHTANYELSQYIGTDITSYLSNYNGDMQKIDAQMKINADDAATAMNDAASAVTASEAAVENAGEALTIAQSANTAAEAAENAASGAQTAAGAAQTDAAAALRASASNSITNLAPAYDPTLTYDVGDLVTYVDPETNTGKLYKCVIAVATPMDFNINYWDDVTTSEVFARGDSPAPDPLVATLTTSGASWSDTLKTLAGSFTINTSKRYIFTETYLDGSIAVRNMDRITSDSIRFSEISGSSTGITGYIFTLSETSPVFTSFNLLTDTYTDNLSASTEAGRVLKVYEVDY